MAFCGAPFWGLRKLGVQNQKSFMWSAQPRAHGQTGTCGHRADGRAQAKVERYVSVDQPMDLRR